MPTNSVRSLFKCFAFFFCVSISSSCCWRRISWNTASVDVASVFKASFVRVVDVDAIRVFAITAGKVVAMRFLCDQKGRYSRWTISSRFHRFRYSYLLCLLC